MSEESPREIAVRLLRGHWAARRGAADEEYSGQSGYIEDLLDKELARRALSPPDRGLCQELVYGIVRFQSTLDWLVSRKTDGRAQKIGLQLLLWLGLYQIFWLDRIPPHAAVHETVELAKRLGFGAQAGFLNAVLRGYLREREQTLVELEKLRQTNPAIGYSHPAWLVDRWRSRWGEPKTIQLLQWNNTPAPVFARLNKLKAGPSSAAAQWEKEGVQFQERQWDWTGSGLVFELRSHPPFGACESFRKGWFYIQDPSTLLAVSELDPKPGETILDLCAAPGGKATFIAQIMQDRGRIIAQDNRPQRLELVKENCARLGIHCVETVCADAQSGSAEGGVPDGLPQFDRVLVDAPCSNTGVLRRRVDLRWRIEPEEIARLASMQRVIIARAGNRLKPGGILVYSTCSLEPEENGAVVEDFLAKRPDFKLLSQRQLLPFADQTDGAYVAKFEKQKLKITKAES